MYDKKFESSIFDEEEVTDSETYCLWKEYEKNSPISLGGDASRVDLKSLVHIKDGKSDRWKEVLLELKNRTLFVYEVRVR